jgi:ribose transport system ATP-binding protein
MTLAILSRLARARWWIDGARETAAADALRARLDVRGRSLEQPVGELSGGNQQKVVIARWLLRDCDVLLFDEPTRGIDVAAKAAVHALLHELAAKGKAIVVVSSEIDELMAVCDRIGVMSDGRLVETFGRGAWSESAILAAAFSGYAAAREVAG